MEVRIEGQNVEVASGSDIATALKAALSGKKFKSVVAVRIGEKEYDLSAPVPEGTQEIEPIFAETPAGTQIIRHSTSHVMALAVKRLFPKALVTIEIGRAHV